MTYLKPLKNIVLTLLKSNGILKFYYFENILSQYQDVLIQEKPSINYHYDFFKFTSELNYILFLYSQKMIYIGDNTNFYMTKKSFKYSVIDVIQSLDNTKYFAFIVNSVENKIDKNVFNFII